MTTKEQARKNLLDFKRVMDRLKIPFCLMDGTLLGAYRDQDFIKEDEDDIDIGVLEKHYGRIPDVVQVLERKDFQKFKVFNVSGRLEGCGFRRGRVHLDIFSVHMQGNKAFNLARTWGRHRLPPVIAYVYPRYCFEKFATIHFQGTCFNIPSQVEDFLSVRYKDWKTWVARKNYDYLDMRQCPCIKRFPLEAESNQ